jgi:hypothetical protein
MSGVALGDATHEISRLRFESALATLQDVADLLSDVRVLESTALVAIVIVGN